MGVLTNLKQKHDSDVRAFFKVTTDAEVDQFHRVSAYARIVISKQKSHSVCEKVFVQGEEQGAPHAEELFYHWFLQGPDSMKPANRVKWLNEHGIPLRLYLYVRKSPCKQCVRVLNVFAKYHATRFEIMKLGFQHLYKSPQGFENPNAYEGYNDCAAYYMSNLSGLWVVTRFSWEDDKYKAKLDKAAIEYAYGCDYWDWRSVKPQPFTSAITDSTTMEQSNNNNNNLM